MMSLFQRDKQRINPLKTIHRCCRRLAESHVTTRFRFIALVEIYVDVNVTD